MPQRRTRVLVVADNDVRAATIEAALRDHADVHVGKFRPRMLANLIDQHDPEVVVVETTVARLESSLEALADAGLPPMIAVVDHAEDAWTGAARRHGVRAVLTLDASAEQITATIDAVTTGLVVLHPAVFGSLAQTVESSDGVRPLTLREREILDMLAEGVSNRVIARRLGISAYTVKFHVASILGKLRAGSRTEAVTLGLRSGLISL